MEKIQLMNVQRQHEQHAAEYEKAVVEVLRSGLYIGGPNVTAFEEEFAEYAGAKYGISCGNGTDAIVLALILVTVMRLLLFPLLSLPPQRGLPLSVQHLCL